MVWSAFAISRMLSFDAASAFGGAVARTVGPWLIWSRQAVRNLERVFPEKSRAEIDRIVRAMWDNLGRAITEYPHLHEIDIYGDGGRVEVVGAENIDRLRDDGRPGIFFAAHLGNWEIAPLGIVQRGLPFAYVYRTANNPAIDDLVREARHDERVEQVPKGPRSARRALQILGAGGHLGMLIDQRMNDGIAVPFFGRPAMTAPALAQLALHFRCPVVPIRTERLGGTRFRITCLPPIEAENTGDRAADTAAFMTRVNAVIEEWVRDRPEQWFWLHRRWRD